MDFKFQNNGIKKHVVHIFGGLGNQMFQYVFYLQLESRRYNSYINLDFFSYKYSKRAHAQSFILKDAFLNINAPVYSCFVSKVLYKPKLWRLFRIFIKIITFKKNNARAFGLITESTIDLKKKRARVLHYKDYWANEKYLLDMQDLHRVFFKFNDELLKGINQLILEEIKNKKSVSIHIRRGDYLFDPFLSKFCKEDYYQQAIQIMEEKIISPHFYLFSDDIEWCKIKFGKLPSKTFIDWNTHERSYIDMLLMSHCKHNICAASTFSWWGALLNKNIDKMVILPKGWMENKTYEHKVFQNLVRI